MIQEDVRLKEDVSGPALKAATGVLALVAAMHGLEGVGGALGGGGGSGGGLGASIAQISGDAKTAQTELKGVAQVAAAEAKAAASVQVAEAAAGAKAQQAAASVSIAAIQAQGAAQIAQGNATAKIIQAQVKRDADLEKEAQKSAAKLVEIEAKKQADIDKLQAREAIKQEAAEKNSGKSLPRHDVGTHNALGDILGKLQGMGVGGQQTQQLSSAMEELGPAAGAAAFGVTAVVGASVAYLGIIGALTAKLFEFGMAASDAKSKMVNHLSVTLGSSAAAKQLTSDIDDMAKSTPVAKEQLQSMAEALALAGLKGDNLKTTLKGLSTVAAIGGEDAANKLQGIIEKSVADGKFDIGVKQLKGTGLTLEDIYGEIAKKAGVGADKVAGMIKAGKVSVTDGIQAMNDAIAKKFGTQNAAAMLDFDTQISKLHENFQDLFHDIDYSGAKTGLQSVLSVFDDSTATGKELKGIINDVFGTLSSLAAKAAPYVRAFLEGAIDGFKEMWEAAKPTIKSIEELFGAGDNKSAIETAKAIGKEVAKVAVYAAYAAAGVLLLVGVVAAAFVGFMAPVILTGIAIGYVVMGIVHVFQDLNSAAGTAGIVLGIMFLPFTVMIGAAIGLTNLLIDGLNKIPGVNIPEISLAGLKGPGKASGGTEGVGAAVAAAATASKTDTTSPSQKAVAAIAAAASGASNDNGVPVPQEVTAAQAGVPSLPKLPAAGPVTNTKTVTVNAPVTINVAGPDGVPGAVKDAGDSVAGHFRGIGEAA